MSPAAGQIIQLFFWGCKGVVRNRKTSPEFNTHTHKNICPPTSPNTDHHKNKSWESAFFKYLFLSLMYLQALICSVGLKYYKHVMFSDPGHLLFKVAFFFFAHFIWMYPVCSSAFVWQFCALTLHRFLNAYLYLSWGVCTYQRRASQGWGTHLLVIRK